MPPPTPSPEHCRPVRRAMWRGWTKRCPACGTGRLLHSYLKVADQCPDCGTALHHHRADDGPAYLTILLVGHLMAPVMLTSYTLWQPDPWVLALSLSVGTVSLALWLLPRFKGLLVGIQWAHRMHGFATPPGPDP